MGTGLIYDGTPPTLVSNLWPAETAAPTAPDRPRVEKRQPGNFCGGDSPNARGGWGVKGVRAAATLCPPRRAVTSVATLSPS